MIKMLLIPTRKLSNIGPIGQNISNKKKQVS